MSSHLEKYWLIIVAFLLVSLIAGGTILIDSHLKAVHQRFHGKSPY